MHFFFLHDSRTYIMQTIQQWRILYFKKTNIKIEWFLVNLNLHWVRQGHESVLMLVICLNFKITGVNQIHHLDLFFPLLPLWQITSLLVVTVNYQY